MYNKTVNRAPGLTPLGVVLTRQPKPLNLENVETINHETFGPRQKDPVQTTTEISDENSRCSSLEKSEAPYQHDFDKRLH